MDRPWNPGTLGRRCVFGPRRTGTETRMSDAVMRKILDPFKLAEKLRQARLNGRTIVQCHGCFDIVHPGHIQYLRFARGLGDVLVVSLTGDENVNKGVDRPYIPQDLRAENLGALEFVDWVVVDPHPTACELLEMLRPDVYVKGQEYARSNDARFRRECEVVERNGGRVVFHGGEVVFSSTRLLESMGRDPGLDEQRLRGFRQRNGIDADVIERTLRSMGDVRAVVVGDLIHDEYVFCDASAAAEDAPVLSANRVGAAEFVSGAALAALQLRALGVKTTLVSAAADDEPSWRAAEALAHAGIDVEWVRNRSGTVRRTTYLADEHKLFKLAEGTCCPLDSAAEKRVAGVIEERLRDARLLLWCDYGYGFVTPGLIAAAKLAGRRGGAVIAASAWGPRGRLTGLEGTDLLTGTERQIREAMHDLGSGMASVVWGALSRTGGQSAIVSVRKRGLIGFDGRPSGDEETVGPMPHDGTRPELARLRSDFVPSFGAHELDLLGADEVLLAAAGAVIGAGGSVPLATYIGAAAEALAGERLGPTTIEARELRAVLSRHAETAESRFVADGRRSRPVSAGSGAGPAARVSTELEAETAA